MVQYLQVGNTNSISMVKYSMLHTFMTLFHATDVNDLSSLSWRVGRGALRRYCFATGGLDSY